MNAFATQFVHKMVCKHEKVEFNPGMLRDNDLGLHSAESKNKVQEHSPITICNI